MISELNFIISPAYGAITLGHSTAEELEVKFAFTQRDINGKMIMRSGFDLKPGSKVIIIEDVTATGNTILEVIEVLNSYDVEIMAIGLVADCSNGKVKKEFEREFNIPLLALLTLDVPNYQPDRCPLCGRAVLLTKPGSSGKK